MWSEGRLLLVRDVQHSVIVPARLVQLFHGGLYTRYFAFDKQKEWLFAILVLAPRHLSKPFCNQIAYLFELKCLERQKSVLGIELLAIGKVGQFRLRVFFNDNHHFVRITFRVGLGLCESFLEGVSLLVGLGHWHDYLFNYNNVCIAYHKSINPK